MTVQELKQLIKSDNVPKFLIFTGDEWRVRQIYIEQIAKVKNLSKYYAYDIDSIYKSLNASALFGQNYLYILQDDKEFMTNEKIYSNITDTLKDNMLILVLTSVDKRLKILKQYKDSIVEFNTLNEAILKRYIQKEIALSDKYCGILMEICNYSYGHCLLEIDKIKRFDSSLVSTTAMNIKDAVFVKLLGDGTIYVPPKDRLWDFIKAFLQNKPLRAYEYYQDLKELETPTFAILTNLYNNARAVYQVQTCKSNNIEKSTGLSNWQIRNAKECVGRFSDRDLEVLMRWVQRIESDIKQGKLDEVIAIDYLFTEFF